MKLVVFCVVLFIVTSCSPIVDRRPVVVGVSTILSGDFAGLGENIVNSAQLALDETPHTTNITLVVEDAGCGNGKGLTVAAKLAEIDGAHAIIGGTCSDDTMAAAPYLNEHHIVYITPVTGGSNIDNAGEYVFRTGNSDLMAGMQPAEDLIKKFNYTKVAIITEQREYTIDIHDNFKKRYEALGGTIVFDEQFAPGNAEFQTPILKIRQAKPEAILVLSQLGTTGGYFIKQSSEQNLDLPIFTTFTTVTNENAKEIAGASMDGVYFYDPEYDAGNLDLQEFMNKYRARYGKDPMIPFHSAATYDSVKMTIEAIDAVGDDGQKIHDWLLANVKDRQGFMGNVSFDENGNTNSGFTLKIVHNGMFERP